MEFTDHVWRSRDGLSLYARDYRGGDEVGARASRPASSSDKLSVICIPGLTRNSRDFEDLAPQLASQGRRVLAVDLRGRGRSDRDKTTRTYRPAFYAADMSALLRSIGAPRAAFLGTSLGGLVIMTLAARRIHEIGAAILNDVGPRVAPAGLARIASYAGKRASIETWDDAAAYVKATNGAAFPHYDDARWRQVSTRLFKDENGKPALDYDPRVFTPAPAWAVRLGSPLLWAAFRRLARARPTLVLRGALSDVLDAATVARMHRVAPKLQSAEIPNVGHAPWLDEPEAQAAIQRFLAEAP